MHVQCPVGSEGCKCTPGGACDPGLSCASQLCVDLGDEPIDAGAGGSGGSAGMSGLGGAGGSAGAEPQPPDPSAMLNASIILPNEGEPLMNPELDATVVLTSPPTSEMQPLMAGSTVSVGIPFMASNANVVAAGIRFGSSGPIRTVMLPDAQGQGDATLSFEFQVPDSVCNDLANICHDIRCYEFAVTDAGRISRENIQSIALMCGNCSEPTCQDLLPAGSCSAECQTDADCEPGQSCSMGACVGEGALRFTLTWSAETDVDLHVVTPNSTEIYYGNRTGDSGELDRDNTSGGSGSVENVFFTDPPVGTYTYHVENYNGRAAASYMLQVFKDGALVDTQSQTLPAEGGATSPMFTVSWP